MQLDSIDSGAAVGAASASGVGHGAGTALAQAGGAIVGAVAGQAVEEVVTRKNGLEMTIKMDDGRTIVIAQVAPPNLNVGDRVRVLSSAGHTRVTSIP